MDRRPCGNNRLHRMAPRGNGSGAHALAALRGEEHLECPSGWSSPRGQQSRDVLLPQERQGRAHQDGQRKAELGPPPRPLRAGPIKLASPGARPKRAPGAGSLGPTYHKNVGRAPTGPARGLSKAPKIEFISRCRASASASDEGDRSLLGLRPRRGSAQKLCPGGETTLPLYLTDPAPARARHQQGAGGRLKIGCLPPALEAGLESDAGLQGEPHQRRQGGLL